MRHLLIVLLSIFSWSPSFSGFWSSGAPNGTPASGTPPNANASFYDSMWSWGSTISDYWTITSDLASKYSLLECDKIKCPTGAIWTQNTSAPKTIPDGCGSYGVALPPQITIGFTECCDKHDLCYSRCRSKRSRCDQVMRACHMDVCHSVSNLLGNDSTIVTGCYKMVETMYHAVANFGCIAFNNAQYEQCYCHKIKPR